MSALVVAAPTDAHISNGLWVCLYCHAFIHAHPRLARERGWLAGGAS